MPRSTAHLEPQPCLGGGCGHPDNDHVRVRELEGPTQLVVWCAGCRRHEIWNTRRLGSAQKLQSILAKALLTRLSKDPDRRPSCAKPTPPSLLRAAEADGGDPETPEAGDGVPGAAPVPPTSPRERFPRMAQRPRPASVPRDPLPRRRPARRGPPDARRKR